MRTLVVSAGPDYSVQDVFVGLAEGLDPLCDVARFNLNDRIAFYAAAQLERDGEMRHAFAFDDACRLAMKDVEAACYEFHPDVVVFVSGFFLDERLAETIHGHGTTVAVVHTESPYEDDKQSERAAWADVNTVNDPTNIDRFPQGTVYFPHCYRPEIHHPGGTVEWDFSFCGTGFESRVEFFEKVDFDGLAVRFAGNWLRLTDDSPLMRFVVDKEHCLDNPQTADLYRASATSANFYRREHHDGDTADGWAVGPREVELAACGTWFARDPRGESDDLFGMLPTFSTPDELGELVRWALDHPTSRQCAALQAREAIADRTYDTFARSLLYLIDQRRRP